MGLSRVILSRKADALDTCRVNAAPGSDKPPANNYLPSLWYIYCQAYACRSGSYESQKQELSGNIALLFLTLLNISRVQLNAFCLY